MAWRSPKSSPPGTLNSSVVVAATFKVLVLGNSDVGKTSLIRLYSTGKVARNLLSTVGECQHRVYSQLGASLYTQLAVWVSVNIGC